MYAKILLMTAILLSGQIYAQSTSNSTITIKTKSKKKKDSSAPATSSTQASSDAVLVVPKNEEAKPSDLEASIAPLTLKELHTFQYIKEHFSASYHGEFYFTRKDVDSANVDDHAIQNITAMHNPTVIYKINKDWQTLATAEFKYNYSSGSPTGTFVNDYHRSLFTLTRKNILVEKERGIQLDAGIGRRDYNTRTTPSIYGNNRIFTTISKTYGKNSGSLFVQYLYNNPKNSVATTWKHGLEIIPTINLQLTEKLSYLFNDDINFNTPKFDNTAREFSMSHEMNLAYLNYQWNDKISTYYQFKYYHTETFTNAPADKDDYFEHYAGVAYAFNPKFTATLEVGSELIHARDSRDLFSKKAQYPELALYLDYSL